MASWKGELLECTGDNTDADCRASAAGCFCPACTFADNYRRAFRSLYVLELLVFVTATTVWFWVLLAGAGTCYPLTLQPGYYAPPAPPSSPPAPPSGAGTTTSDGAPADTATVDSAQAAFATLLAAAEAQQAEYNSCTHNYAAAMVGMLFLFVLFFAYGARRRSSMRARFNLPGDSCSDCGAWFFCCWAAICQEARTLRHNGVSGGKWAGPAAAEEAGALVPPSRGKALEMESRV